MGQKTHPVGFRIGITKNWDSRWFAHQRNFSQGLYDDNKIRTYLNRRLNDSKVGFSKIEIEKAVDNITITIHTSTPGKIIGKQGKEITNLREEVKGLINKEVNLKIQEVQSPELDAKLVADNIMNQIVQRVSFKRAMKRAVTNAMRQGAKGIKVTCSGRLGGAEIARTEWYREGNIPLHTLRADIDYAQTTAHTLSGTVGIKTWIFKGLIMNDEDQHRLNQLGLLGAKKEKKRK
ncbi:30S ribosomal protein S3 [candidate division WOR-3 bacterium]|nr:30S ribosomal protein S3 [candidate division WOR-3 bacterium]